MFKRWSIIIALWLLGVLAAAQLAKISTIAPLLREGFGLSLPATGLLISLLEIGGATLGFVAGLALSRIGCRRSLMAGMALLTICSLAEALAPSSTILFAARAVEGIGYLLVVIAAPTAIAASASETDRPRALALWSSFVPVGVAGGGMITALLAGWIELPAVLGVWAVLLGLAAMVLLRLPVNEGPRGQMARLPAPAAWVATFGFGLYTLFVCALTMLLPTFLIEQRGASVGSAGIVTAVAAFSALPASLVAMLAMRGGLTSRRMIGIASLTLIACAWLSPLIFHDSVSGALAGIVAVAALAVSGLVSPLIFARLPQLAGAEAANDPRIASTNGLLTQFGAGGALLGPPLGGLVVDLWGWPALGWAIAVLSVTMLGITALAEWLNSLREAGRAIDRGLLQDPGNS